MEGILPIWAPPLIQNVIDQIYSLKPYIEPTVCLGK